MTIKEHKYDKRYLFYIFIILTIVIIGNFFVSIDFASNTYENNRPVAVMVGNSNKERLYQKGISKADIVYEIEVEFPFTRYMALYFSDSDTIIGPIRSSRYYFSRICSEWTAIFAHCGGQNLRNEGIFDIDQMKCPSPYWRDSQIGGWINLFTSIAKLREEAEKKENQIKKNDLKHHLLNFDNLNKKNNNSIKKITIKYHKDYIVSYEYKEGQLKYYQYINNKPHLDKETGEIIKVSNIIIQYVNVEKIIDDELGRVDVELVGEGIAKIFSNGNYSIAKWVKSAKNNKTIFLDNNGDEIVYNKGNHWVHILSTKAEVWIK